MLGEEGDLERRPRLLRRPLLLSSGTVLVRAAKEAGW